VLSDAPFPTCGYPDPLTPPHSPHPCSTPACLQFHGHAQVMLSDAPFPSLQHEAEAVACYDLTASTMSRGYYQDVLAAHEEVGCTCNQAGRQAGRLAGWLAGRRAWGRCGPLKQTSPFITSPVGFTSPPTLMPSARLPHAT